MNVVAITGHICNDLNLKTTDSGKECVHFALAVYATKEITHFINCQAWGTNAKYICDHFHKGERVGITGSLNSYTREVGEQKTNIVNVVVGNIERCLAKAPKSENDEDYAGEQLVIPADDDEDGLPF